MPKTDLFEQISGKEVAEEEIASQVVESPELLYPKIGFFIRNLDCDNKSSIRFMPNFLPFKDKLIIGWS